jgi:hypothetical protein
MQRLLSLCLMSCPSYLLFNTICLLVLRFFKVIVDPFQGLPNYENIQNPDSSYSRLLMQGLQKFLVEENGFNNDRVMKVSTPVFINQSIFDCNPLLLDESSDHYMCIFWFLQAIEKIKVAKNKSSQGRCVIHSFDADDQCWRAYS